jgi:hypothetical protein
MKRNHAFIFIALLFLITSCAVARPSNSESPDVGIPQTAMNKDFKLTFFQGENSFRNDERLLYHISVISENPIFFNDDYGVQIFAYLNSTWVKIDDRTEIGGDGTGYILYQSIDDPWEMGTSSVHPYIPNLKDTVVVRLILIGNRVRGEKITDELTAAYIDFELSPSSKTFK